jgi:hypothetical protein
MHKQGFILHFSDFSTNFYEFWKFRRIPVIKSGKKLGN